MSIKKPAIILIVVFFMLTGFLFLGRSTFAAEPEYNWRMSQIHPEGSDYDIRAKEFARKVFERSNGRIKIDVYSGGVLGDWTEVFEMIMRGTIEMGLQQANANFDPQLNLAYYFPYLFTTFEEAKEVYGPGGWTFRVNQSLWEKHNIKALDVLPVGMAGLSLSKLPDKYDVPTVQKGVKVRVMPIKPCEWTYEALGYIPTPIPYAEVYTSLQMGIADGQMGGPPFQAWQFRDVQKVWIQYNDYIETWWFVINKSLWDKLSPEDQQILTQAAQEEARIQWDKAEEVDEEYRQKLEDEYGWTIVMLSDDQLNSIANHVRKVVWPKMETIVGTELMNRIYEESGIPRP
ncbi:MAG: TRAP transporter substrate-binding protein DctP [Acetomicrobium sp.]|nr:TRAP transporter substrate-binding protein DctP [Acetomicrobium sp.]